MTVRGSPTVMVTRRNLSAETEAPVGPVYRTGAEPVGRQLSSSYSRSRREAARPLAAHRRRKSAVYGCCGRTFVPAGCWR